MKIKSFSRNGANLAEDKKNKLREIDKELSKTSLQFGENVLAETQGFELHITNDEDLSGLPEGTIEAARSLAKAKKKKAGSSR
jgi:peptidyl-dipeptidase Dcp